MKIKSSSKSSLKKALYKNSSAPAEDRANDLLSRMTLREKIGQLNQIFTREKDEVIRSLIQAGDLGSLLLAESMFAGSTPQPAVNVRRNNEWQRVAVEQTRLGIPLIYGRDIIHGHATMWPIPLGMAATWDPDLLEASASLIAEQATSVGVRWAFAPMVDISRDPRWGRIAESFGEDPCLSGQLGSAVVRGYQGRKTGDLKNPNKMAACLKHYVGYGGAEGGRDYNTTEWGENTLRNNHIIPFREGIKAGAQTVMSGFHEISGEPMSSNRYLLTDVLRGEFGFDGFVVSDCYSVQELVNHRRATNNARAAELSLRAGIDMDMCSKAYLEELAGVVEKNLRILKDIDVAVRRILLVKFRLGLFETPYTDEKNIISRRSREKYEKSALEVARKSAILLKNKANILPLTIKGKKIAIVGPMIDERRSLLGTWSSDGDLNDVKTISEHFRTLEGDFIFAGNMEDVGPAVQQADLSILFVGEQKSRSGEGSVVTDITLPHGQDDLIWECAQYGKPLIVVALTGRPIVLDVADKVADAVLLQFHAGTMTARSLADVIFGVAEPLGRLPATMPYLSGQIPIHYNFKSTGRPLHQGWWSGAYKNSVKTPLYPFGYGLGYTTFSVLNLKLSAKKISIGEKVRASVEVKNTGSRTGETIVQLYLRDEFSEKTRPVRELKAFRKVKLSSGKSKVITFTLGPEDLSYYGAENQWTLEPGEFAIFAGVDSRASLSASFTVVE